ncbi:MAG: GNAT family N-acetyltransferase [Candidatus Aenigmarchaeota archaeon]|nr:GNAT family N-acetyltransferase [Candidatus Aenigmarchaeota archaeon]
MKVRLAKPADVDEISGIVSVLDTKQTMPSDIGRIGKHISAGEYFVAQDSGRVVGAMILYFDDENCQLVLIASKKGGAGRLLVGYAERMCREKGVHKLWCWSLARYKARGFYENMGFREAFLLRKQFFGEDCWLFGKVIR